MLNDKLRTGKCGEALNILHQAVASSTQREYALQVCRFTLHLFLDCGVILNLLHSDEALEHFTRNFTAASDAVLRSDVENCLGAITECIKASYHAPRTKAMAWLRALVQAKSNNHRLSSDVHDKIVDAMDDISLGRRELMGASFVQELRASTKNLSNAKLYGLLQPRPQWMPAGGFAEMEALVKNERVLEVGGDVREALLWILQVQLCSRLLTFSLHIIRHSTRQAKLT
tara:strand:- start:431 stop:1117 length:687 start_codon:yes stop_codon:yes gene_type:complete